jgi:hypothetical protein
MNNQTSQIQPEPFICHIGISSSGHGGRRRSMPYAFMEEGVAMLSSVLRSSRTIANRLRKDRLRSVSQASTFNHQLLGDSDWAQLRLTHSQLLTLNHQLASAPPQTPRRPPLTGS